MSENFDIWNANLNEMQQLVSTDKAAAVSVGVQINRAWNEATIKLAQAKESKDPIEQAAAESEIKRIGRVKEWFKTATASQADEVLRAAIKKLKK